jgi:tRNA A37 threonylcarbamoyladenosine synthetase subunit TsaC/SUA5/YrdC
MAINMKILKVSKNVTKVSREKIKIAAKEKGGGRTIIYPTETSYTLGCDATNEKTIKAIWAHRKLLFQLFFYEFFY